MARLIKINAITIFKAEICIWLCIRRMLDSRYTYPETIDIPHAWNMCAETKLNTLIEQSVDNVLYKNKIL